MVGDMAGDTVEIVLTINDDNRVEFTECIDIEVDSTDMTVGFVGSTTGQICIEDNNCE